MPNTHRHTKIVFTVGPASTPPATLHALITSGADVCRINMAHASHADVRNTVSAVRGACTKAGRHVALLMDVKGPEIRTSTIAHNIQLKPDQTLTFTTENHDPTTATPTTHSVAVNYPGLPADIHPGDTVLVDSGLLRLEVLSTSTTSATCRVVIGGELGSKRHINLPGVNVRLPSLTDKDKADIAVGVELGIDFFALSFARDASAINTLRSHLDGLGSPARIVAKIEDQSGVKNIGAIVRATDAVMIARGDLGIEIPYEQLPGVQAEIGKACLAEGKPFIVATQLLESMVDNPMPTRAEITDVANAVQELADAVMLSGETAVGKYPAECVAALNRIIDHVEPNTHHKLNDLIQLKDSKTKILRSAAVLAKEIDGAIVVFTKSGYLPAVLAALRPDAVPVYAFTDSAATFHQLLLYWGIEPFLMPFSDDPETTIEHAFSCLIEKNWAASGDEIVVITNALARDSIIDTIQLRTISA